jgi:ABC-type transport system involved in multi-copper enzyme maturation permease subunit
MRLIRAGLFAIVLWVLIFFEVSILMFGLGLGEGNPIFHTIHFVFASLFVIVLGFAYFYPKKVKKGFLQGLLVGIIFVVIGIILDCVITIPIFIIPQGGSYVFLIKPYILLQEIWTIVLCFLVGMIKKS